MIDLDIIKAAVPDEALLKNVIESDTLSVIVDDSYDADGMETFIEALITFTSRAGVDFRMALIGNRLPEPTFRSLCQRYGIMSKTEYIYDGDDTRTLSNYLCSNVLFTRFIDGAPVKLAKDLYLPVVATNTDREDVVFDDIKGIFHIDETSEGIASALMVINEKKYRELFSGFRKVVREEV